MSLLDQLKDSIKQELPQLDCVIGWQQGFDPLHGTPLFMRNAEDVDRLIDGPLCAPNLAAFLPNMKGKKVGIVVKGCDSRSVVELLQEKLIKREDVVIFSRPCSGVVDLSKVRKAIGDVGRVTSFEAADDLITLTAGGEKFSLALRDIAADKCSFCRYPSAVLADHFLGEQQDPADMQEVVPAEMEAFEKLTIPERFEFWKGQMSRCIRCYACRNACPMCVCRDQCVGQSRDPLWLSQDDSVRDKWMFQFIHAMHLAGRCTECGECQRVCPMDIPLLIIKRHMNRGINELFDYEAGTNPDETPPLLTFKVEEENINERGW